MFLFASARLRSDKDFVLAVLQLDGNSLAFASRDLRADAEVIFTAVRQCPLAIRYAIGMETLAHEMIQEKDRYAGRYNNASVPFARDCLLGGLLGAAYNKFRQRTYRSAGRRRCILQIASEIWPALQRRRSEQRQWRSAMEAEEAFWSKCSPKWTPKKIRPYNWQDKHECDEVCCAGGCGPHEGARDIKPKFDLSRGRALQLKVARRHARDEKSLWVGSATEF